QGVGLSPVPARRGARRIDRAVQLENVEHRRLRAGQIAAYRARHVERELYPASPEFEQLERAVDDRQPVRGRQGQIDVEPGEADVHVLDRRKLPLRQAYRAFARGVAAGNQVVGEVIGALRGDRSENDRRAPDQPGPQVRLDVGMRRGTGDRRGQRETGQQGPTGPNTDTVHGHPPVPRTTNWRIV